MVTSQLLPIGNLRAVPRARNCKVGRRACAVETDNDRRSCGRVPEAEGGSQMCEVAGIVRWYSQAGLSVGRMSTSSVSPLPVDQPLVVALVYASGISVVMMMICTSRSAT